MEINQITLVTGNTHKLVEWQTIFDANFHLQSRAVSIEEIQGDGNPETILEHKVRAAYEIVGAPVIVEDVSMHIDKFGGLPGPFIKYFMDVRKDILWDMVGQTTSSAHAVCYTAFYDGANLITAQGNIAGEIVAPAGDDGFGFDYTFRPSGQSKTYAQMGIEQKAAISHRTLAARALLEKLRAL